MRTKIQKWDDSLALCIPQEIADEIGLQDGLTVEIKLIDGSIQITCFPKIEYELEALLADVTPANLHQEFNYGD